jgi:hypothetical protein
MVAAMPSDRSTALRVACLALIAGCGPKIAPAGPPPEPGPVAKMQRTPAATSGRQLVIGEMCPQAAGGRPAIAPLVIRTVQWSDAAADVSAAVERGSVPRFIVFGTDGKMAGAFDTMGLVDIGLQQPVASGAYAGASPCTYEVSAKPGDPKLATRAEDPKCGQVTGGCGLAAGEIEHPDDPPEIVKYDTGGACVSGDALAVDIDGDGRPEAFPLAQVLDGIRGPAQEWAAAPTGGAAGTPHFELYDLKLVPEADPGKPVDQKAIVMMDVLGVVDLDGDGRKEIVLALRFPTVRSIVVYSPVQSAERLELVGEATSFPR